MTQQTYAEAILDTLNEQFTTHTDMDEYCRKFAKFVEVRVLWKNNISSTYTFGDESKLEMESTVTFRIK